MSYLTIDILKHRNTLSRNIPALSVGAFDQNKMVGFLNVSMDNINGELVAFDGGTGIIKKYRGRGIANKLFTKAIAELKERGVKKFTLEVLQSNLAAINAYKKEGFSISRKLHCYNMSSSDYQGKNSIIEDVTIKKTTLTELENYWHFIKYPLSWEHMYSGLRLVEEELVILSAFQKDECIGFVVYDPQLCWITAIGIKNQSSGMTELVDYLLESLFKTIRKPLRPIY